MKRLKDTRHGNAGSPPPVESFSVVIPTLNESANITGAVESLRDEDKLLETIVVDCGSTDGTLAFAEGLGARVITGPRGRGLQIREGIIQCRGDVVLILHADCRIRAGVFARIAEQLDRDSRILGGALGMEYDSRTPKTRFLSFLNNMRAKHLGIAFGDQCQFFRRKCVSGFGGYPAQMLMEDIELSMRMKASGAVCFLPRGVVVSHRRWAEKGFLRNFVRVLRLSLGYLIMRPFRSSETLAEDLYFRYYGKT